MQRTWLLGVVVALAIGYRPAEAEDVVLSGDYDCAGTNQDGTTYKSTVKIDKVGDVYMLQWYFPSPPGSAPTAERKKSHNGIALLRGGLLASNWTMEQSGKAISGIVVYKVQGKQLVGEWAVGNDGRVMRETLTKR